nr:MAG: hypothetical protein [Microvirus sp.]QJB19674.1 MAG: hypothetical protein [Microvirus sp.]
MKTTQKRQTQRLNIKKIKHELINTYHSYLLTKLNEQDKNVLNKLKNLIMDLSNIENTPTKD